MGNKKQPLLKAVQYNWDLIGPGDWTEVKWRIFYDGSYEITSTFNASFEDYKNAHERKERPEPEKKKTTGEMADEDFSKLREAIKCEPWRDPFLNVDACDGVAWEIESYREDGGIENTSGKPTYIYFQRVLEEIVSLLPIDGSLYDSSAFISLSP